MIFVVADSRDRAPDRVAVALLRRRRHPRLRQRPRSSTPARTARDNDLNGFIFADTPALALAGRGGRAHCAPTCKRIGRSARALLRVLRHGLRRVRAHRVVVRERWRAMVDARAIGRPVARRARPRAPRAAARAVPQRPARRARHTALCNRSTRAASSASAECSSRAADSGSRAPRPTSSGTGSRSSRAAIAAGSASSISCAATTGSSSSSKCARAAAARCARPSTASTRTSAAASCRRRAIC